MILNETPPQAVEGLDVIKTRSRSEQQFASDRVNRKERDPVRSA